MRGGFVLCDHEISSLENADVEGIMLPPAMLEEMSHKDEYIRPLAKLNLVLFGGGQ